MILNAHKGQGVTIALAIVLFIGLAIRLSYLMINAGAPDFDSPVLDPQLNDYWARALVTSDWSPPPHADDPQIRTTPYGRPPGYPWLLAALYYLSNGSYVIPRIVQLLVGLINIILVFFLTKRLFNAQAGIAAAFLLSVYWAAVYFEGELNSPVWEVFLSLSTVLILLRWEERNHIFLLVLAGITLGAGVLLRPNVLLTGVFFTLWIFYIGYKRYGTSSKSIVRCGVFIIACILTLAPALIRNYAVSGEFVLISYYGGINTYIGNNTEADGVSPTVPDLYEISGSDQWNCFTYPHVVQGLGRYLK
ncbi:MAG: glycosyltransferase family 39 protein, partial [Candidatus Hydrogenedentes bacterium]|nr:glycosyltransferase family 39 protein [Candidatus Hydrogenedentota bacterium]